MLSSWLSFPPQLFEAKYYFCLTISIAALAVTSSGFHFTEKEQIEPRFTVLVSLPIALISFAVFLFLGLWLSLIIALFIFLALLFLGDLINYAGASCYTAYDGWIPYEPPISRKIPIFFYRCLLWGIPSIITVTGFLLCWMFEGWLITAWVFGGILIIFIIVAVIDYAEPFFGYVALGTILAIVGYAAYNRFDFITFSSLATFGGLIVLHLVLDGLKAHGSYNFFNPVHGIGWSSVSEYSGSSTILLGLALVTAVGFASYLLFGSAIVVIVWIIPSIICYGTFVYLSMMEEWIWGYTVVLVIIISTATIFPLIKWIIA